MKPNVSANAFLPAPVADACGPRIAEACGSRIAEACGSRRLALGLAVALLLGASGCRICADCEDMAYPAYGGSWQRTNRDSGRVASLFDPAGAKSGSMVGRDTPEEVDELERRRRVESGQDQGDDEDDDLGTYPDPSDRDGARDKDDFKDLKDQDLKEMENDESNKLRDLELEDIEVKQVPESRDPIALR